MAEPEPTPRATLPDPTIDIAVLNNQIGRAWGVSCAESIPQLLAWCEQAGIFAALAREPMPTAELAARTPLSDSGLAALLPILASLGLTRRAADGALRLTPLAREYLLAGSPYYVGTGLYWDCHEPIPSHYLAEPGAAAPPPAPRWPAAVRVAVPHSRNFAPSVAAARSGAFDRVRHLVDVGGGSGVFAIPMALDHPDAHVTLVDLPDAIPAARDSLAKYGLADRIALVGMDMFRDEWSFGFCDGMFFGNVFHASGDDACRALAQNCFASLAPGGIVGVHEVVFDDGKDGPLLAALWNANMIARRREARQRTVAEIVALLESAGFGDCLAMPTAGEFWLVTGTKPDEQ